MILIYVRNAGVLTVILPLATLTIYRGKRVPGVGKTRIAVRLTKLKMVMIDSLMASRFLPS